MKNIKSKFEIISIIFYFILISCSVYVILDAFVIPHKGVLLQNNESSNEKIGNVYTDNTVNNKNDNSSTIAKNAKNNNSNGSEVDTTSNSYKDDNISIKIKTERTNNTTYYVADISISDSNYLKTAFAENTYGRNIKETTSAIAKDNKAIFAINGDYYGFRDDGYVIRNGLLYRDIASDDNEALVVDKNGDFSIVNQLEVSAQELLNDGAWQVLSFGPGLIENGEIIVNKNEEVSRAKNSNPRTAIGQIDSLHYIAVVADGRTNKSQGLSLYELAEVMKANNCKVAYNLDGGGSSTMYFNGKVINNPTNGMNSGERSVSDIVYIGY